MKKTYAKIIIQEIKSSFGRFMAIFGIVALSVGFLSGLSATTPTMKATVDKYYDDNNMTDIFIKGTMGLTLKDADAVLAVDGVKEVMPAYVTDALVDVNNNEVLVSRIYGVPLLNEKISSLINRPELISGRLPAGRGECVVERSGGYIAEVKIGSKICISRENEDFENIGDTYDITEFTVVGIVSNPFYFSVESERSSLGNGRIGCILYVDESCYSMDVYTDLHVRAEGGTELTAFTDAYEGYVEGIADELEAIGKKQSLIRESDIKDEAYEKINDAKAEYEDAKKTADSELSDAAKKISDGKIKLRDAAADVSDGEIKLADAKRELQEEFEKAGKEITDGYAELHDARAELEDGEVKYEDGQDELNDGLREYGEGFGKYEDSRQELERAQKKLDEGEKEYLDGLKELEKGKKELKSGRRELSEARNKLEQGELEYNAGLNSFELQKGQFNMLMTQVTIAAGQMGFSYTSPDALFGDLERDSQGTTASAITGILYGIKSETGSPDIPGNVNELLYSRNALIEGEASLKASKEQLSDGWRQYERGRSRLRTGEEELAEAESELEDAGKELEENRTKIKDGWDELDKAKIDLTDARDKLVDGFQEAGDARRKLDDGWSEYYDGLEDIREAENTLRDETEKANKKISDAEIDLADGHRDYKKGMNDLTEGEDEYNKSKNKAEYELDDAYKKIADAEKEIADLKLPKWYVLDRKSNVSYASFSVNASKIADITKVFPVFFFLIAALVTLTTMTRMVEEERTQMGTLKALGYRKSSIISKYIIYCGTSSTLGSIAGVIIGFKLLPGIIWNAYRSMYRLPNLVDLFIWEYAVPQALLAVLLTVFVTVYVCGNSLKEKPSILMLPRAPKAGKRILLERVGFIWNRMKFTHKSTARNIFRYKKHLFMTIIGISGCTALMLTGFGLRDAIGSIANTQFTDIFKYDLMAELDEEKEGVQELYNFLNDKDNVKSFSRVMSETGYIYKDREKFTATVLVPFDSNEVGNSVNLRDRKTGNAIEFRDSSVIMTEKLAEELGIAAGDSFVLEDYDGETADFVLSQTTENYVGSYIYIGKAAYADGYGRDIDYDTLFIKTSGDFNGSTDDAVRGLLEYEAVMSAEPMSQIKKSFDNLLSNMGFIVVVLIVSAGMLAVIVLYNLTNININERRKELSALKVLGYHNEEVAAYVYRETSILSIAGTFLGLFLGVWLLNFIINTVEASNLMLGRKILPVSFVYSAVLTLLFSMAVNIILYKKLKKIEMVESMKAVD